MSRQTGSPPDVGVAGGRVGRPGRLPRPRLCGRSGAARRRVRRPSKHPPGAGRPSPVLRKQRLSANGGPASVAGGRERSRRHGRRMGNGAPALGGESARGRKSLPESASPPAERWIRAAAPVSPSRWRTAASPAAAETPGGQRAASPVARRSATTLRPRRAETRRGRRSLAAPTPRTVAKRRHSAGVRRAGPTRPRDRRQPTGRPGRLPPPRRCPRTGAARRRVRARPRLPRSPNGLPRGATGSNGPPRPAHRDPRRAAGGAVTAEPAPGGLRGGGVRR